MSTPSPLALQLANALQGRFVVLRNMAVSAETEEVAAFIDTVLAPACHDACHDLHLRGPVDLNAFCAGCEAYQYRLYGASPIADLRAEVARLKAGIKTAEVTMIVDGGDMCDWGWATHRDANRLRAALECALDYQHHMAPEDVAAIRAAYEETRP